jgi:exodeoxyribonuclease III
VPACLPYRGVFRHTVTNIRQGGGRRLGAICDAIIGHAPDVIILTEYRSTPGEPLLSRLADVAWPHFATCEPPPRENGIAVLAREPLVRRPPILPDRWVEVELPVQGFTLAAVHVPVRGRDVRRKDAYWRRLLEYPSLRRSTPFLFAGDWNTGAPLGDAEPEGRGFSCCEHFAAMSEHGFVDAWRRLHPDGRAYSWYSRRKGRELNGFRIDHAFLSEPLSIRLLACDYSDDERRAGVSDHAPLLLELQDKHG